MTPVRWNYVTTPTDQERAVSGLERLTAAFLDDLSPAWSELVDTYRGLHRRADGAVLLVDKAGAMHWTGILDSGARFTMAGMELSLSWPSGREFGPFDSVRRGWQGLEWTLSGQLVFTPLVVFDYQVSCPWEAIDQRHLSFDAVDDAFERDGRTVSGDGDHDCLRWLAEGPDMFELTGEVLLPGEWPDLEVREGSRLPR